MYETLEVDPFPHRMPAYMAAESEESARFTSLI
jgi:hypothetical protein